MWRGCCHLVRHVSVGLTKFLGVHELVLCWIQSIGIDVVQEVAVFVWVCLLVPDELPMDEFLVFSLHVHGESLDAFFYLV